ncbi:SapB/AmfS family lanthipeptide [Nocardiopsis sp. FIRDI 009]|nr:SapB/AmfS family lanthipeptide [Nocardiopsis sp. FIRDI 009]
MSFVLNLQSLDSDNATGEEGLGPLSTESVFACQSGTSFFWC